MLEFMLECRSLGRRTFAKMQRSIYENFEDSFVRAYKTHSFGRSIMYVVPCWIDWGRTFFPLTRTDIMLPFTVPPHANTI